MEFLILFGKQNRLHLLIELINLVAMETAQLKEQLHKYIEQANEQSSI